MIDYRVIAISGEASRPICLRCGRLDVYSSYFCPCGGLSVLVVSDNSVDGVDEEISRLVNSKDARTELFYQKFSNYGFPL